MGIIEDMKRSVEFGDINKELVCPHCQKPGQIRTKEVKRKKGISKGKVAAAVLFSPVTLLATGLSRKEKGIDAHCDNCGITWEMA